MRRIGIVTTVLTIVAVSSLGAQQARSVFRSGVEIVALNVSVTDASGHLVQGLTRGDFVVFEDGVPQDLSFFADVPVPIDLAILLDSSASMTEKMTTVQQAAIGFTHNVRPGDRVTVVDIKDMLRVLHPLNEDVDTARQAITRTSPSGNTALYNGLYLTLKELVKERRDDGEIRRQAIVVLSDGDDTTSLIGFEDVMELAKGSGVAVYTITVRSSLEIRSLATRNRALLAAADYEMKAIAQETGGRAFFPEAIEELAGVYGSIADELARQYSLGYIPINTELDGSYRRITVRVDRPGLRAHTRAGYIAADSPVAGR